MGIDFKVDGIDMEYKDRASWSYSGFNQFRRRLAAAIGIELDTMEGFGMGKGDIPWRGHMSDPICRLLNHSDCDGYLSAKSCALIAPRLRELTKDWPESMFEEYGYDRIHSWKLADMMDIAASNNKCLIFC